MNCVVSGIGSLGFSVDVLGSDLVRLEFDPLIGVNVFTIYRPAGLWHWVCGVGHRDREGLACDHRHVADAQIARNLRGNWK